MPFANRPYRRVPTCFPDNSQVEDFLGYGTVWNPSFSASHSPICYRYK